MVRIFHNIFKGNVELKEIYANRIIDYFAISLIGIFIPIYFLQMGFALQHIFGYFIFSWGSAFIMAFFAAHTASILGLKRTIVIRVPILIAFLFLLTNLRYLHPAFLYGTAILGGIASAFYWIPLNSEFVRNAESKKAGMQTGYYTAIPRFFVIFAPFLGGIMLQYLGFDVVFILVMLLVALSVIPLSFTGECLINFNYNIKEEKPLKRAPKFSGKFLIQGMLWVIEGLIWPIYIFLSLNDIVSVGIAGTMSIFGISIFTIFVGRFSDKVNKNNIIKIGAILFAAVWIMRIFSISSMEFFILSFLGGLCLALIDVPMFTMFSKLSKRNPLAMIVSREVRLHIGRLIMLFLLLLVVLSLSTIGLFPFAFAFAAVMALGLLVL